MPPIQTAQGSATSGSTVSATFGSGTTGGASIIALVSNQSGRTVTSIALTGSSDTFTQAESVLEGTFGEDSEIWIDLSDASGHTQVVVTFSGTIADAELTIIEWPAGISSATADKVNSGTSTSGVTAWSSGSTGTLTQPSEIAFGVVTVNTEGGADTLTGPGSPWTNLAQINAAAGISQLAGYQQTSTTAALTYNGTSSVSVAYAACIATFKFTAAAAGPAPFTPPRQAPRGAPGARRGRSLSGLSSPGAPVNNPKILLISLASAGGTDDYGNPYPQGILATAGLIQGPEIIAGNAPNTQIELIIVGGAGFLRFVLNSASFANAAMFSQIIGSFAQLAITGPHNTAAGFTDLVSILFNSSDGASSFANLGFQYTDNSGTVHQYAFMDGSGFNITTGSVTATQPGTGTAEGNPAIAETWHAAGLPGGWGGGIAYKKYPDNTVGLAGTVTLPGSGSYNNVTLFNLPSGYIPPGTKNVAMAGFAQSSAYGNNASSGGLPRVVITSGGAVSFAGIPASVNSSQVCVDGVRFPVDF